MIYKFIDNQGTFVVQNPHLYNLYFPLTNRDGKLLSAICPNLAGDIKQDNEHFLTLPSSIEDTRSNFLCRRDFFIKADKNIIRCSMPYGKDILEAGFLYHKMIKEAFPLHIEILNFIPADHAVEIMCVKVSNKSNKKIKITPTSFIPLYGRGESNLRDHRHVSSLLNRIDISPYGINLKPTMIFDEKGHRINEMIYSVLGYEEEAIAPVGQFPALDYFYGKGDILCPEAIIGKVKPVKDKLPHHPSSPLMGEEKGERGSLFDGKEACGSLRFRERYLKKGEEANYFIIMGIDKEKSNISNTFKKLNSPDKIKTSFQETQKYWLNYLSQLTFDFKDKNYNNWLLWVKVQPQLRKLFGCSFLPHFDYGKGGRGWRDLWQDALSLLLTEPGKAKELIGHNFKGVRIDGSNATIITRVGSFLSDRNRISRVWMDHGVWPYLTLRLYIHRTGDIDILLENTTYFRDHLIRRAKEIDYNFPSDYLLRTVDGALYQGNVLEHILIQNIVQFFNVGKHNVIRLENADWNDGLDMAPDAGESVTFSFMYAHNLADVCIFLEELKKKNRSVFLLKEFIILLDRLDKEKRVDYSDYKEKQKRLEEYFSAIKNTQGKKIEVNLEDLIADLKEKSAYLFNHLKNQEWLAEGFFNGYYDNSSKQAEGKSKGGLRMMLPSQVFAIMSGCLEKGKIEKILQSINRYLKDKKLGGFHLNTNFKSLYMDLGRAFGFSYGDKENGAFFNHMVVMLAFALYKQGFIKEGGEVINSIYKMAAAPQGGIYPIIPEYFNNEGRGLYLYLTGSASWYIYTLLEEIAGIKGYLGGIQLLPKLTPSNFFKDTIDISCVMQEKKINVSFIKIKDKNKHGSKPFKIKEVFLERERINPEDNKFIIKKEILAELNQREIEIKIYLC